MPQSSFDVSQRDCILHVTINRPQKRNALSREALAELKGIFLQHAEDDSLFAAVLRGAGEESFAAGGDLKDFDLVRSASEAAQMSQLGFDALRAIRQFPVPVVAAVNGVALGGGAELAMACDYRVAAAHARIGFIQGTLGISSSWGGAIYLAERVGTGSAMRLLCTGEILGAGDALQNQVVDVACPPGDLLEDAVDKFLAPFRNSTLQSIRAAKALTIDASRLWLETLRQSEQRLFVENWVSEEHWQRVESAIKK